MARLQMHMCSGMFGPEPCTSGSMENVSVSAVFIMGGEIFLAFAWREPKPKSIESSSSKACNIRGPSSTLLEYEYSRIPVSGRGKEHRNVTVNRYPSILSRSELSHLSKFRNTEKYDFSYICRVLVQIYLLSFTCIMHIWNFILSYSGLVKNFSVFSNTSWASWHQAFAFISIST